MDELYAKEKNFLNRVLVTKAQKWQPRVMETLGIAELLSPALPPEEAMQIHKLFKDAFAYRVGLLIDKLVKTIEVANPKGHKRIVINLKMLREKFAGEIDGWAGGGGRGLNPKSNPTSPLSTRLIRR